MTALAKLNDYLALIDTQIVATEDISKLEYLVAHRANVQSAIAAPTPVTIAGGVSIDLSVVSEEIQQATNLQNVGTNLGNISTNTTGLIDAVTSAKGAGVTNATTLRTVLADNTFLYTLLGELADAASVTGSHNAKLRFIGERLAAILATPLPVASVSDSNLLNALSGINTQTQAVKTAVDATVRPIPLTYRALGTAVTATIKSGSTQLHALSATNLATATRYLMLFNSTGSTSTPVMSYPVFGNNGFTVLDNEYFAATYQLFSTGLTYAFSVQPLVYEAATSTECIIEARYI